MKLTPENCPDLSEKRRETINALSDEELTLEIEKGPASRFGAKMIPVLRTAKRFRDAEIEARAREEELNIARNANEIAGQALEAANTANSIAKESKLWAAAAVLIAAVTAVIIWLSK